MCADKGLINPPPLTSDKPTGTLAGGTAGSKQKAKPSTQSASSVAKASDSVSAQAELVRTAHHALSAMVAGFLDKDRELLDSGFEDLVGCLEEMRDAVPKVS